MAIQTNKRKRKHEAAAVDQVDDAEIAVPKKVQKESDTPKRKAKDRKHVEPTKELPEEEPHGEEKETTKKKKKSKHTQQVDKPDEELEESTNLQEGQEDQEEEYERTDEAEISPDSGIEPEEKPLRFPNDFKMMNFRNKLLGNNFITGML